MTQYQSHTLLGNLMKIILSEFSKVYDNLDSSSGLYYKHVTIVNDDSSIVSKWSFKLIDDPRVISYDRHRFIIQATGHSFLLNFLALHSGDNTRDRWYNYQTTRLIPGNQCCESHINDNKNWFSLLAMLCLPFWLSKMLVLLASPGDVIYCSPHYWLIYLITNVGFTKESSLNGKDHYSWRPCTN